MDDEKRLPIDDADAALYTVGQVADMLSTQAPYLRRLDQEEVVQPSRSAGGQRRYSRRQVERARRAVDLADEGLSVAGIRHVLNLEDQVADLEAQLDAERRRAGRRGGGRREDIGSTDADADDGTAPGPP
jgi:MerR family transcriptional regulator/heat shock protein HspR